MKPSARLIRRLLVVAMLTAVVLVAMWYLWPEPAIGPASFRRIQPGMRQAEVEAIIGLPPGGYHEDPGGVSWSLREKMGLSIYGRGNDCANASWWGTKYAICVTFDAHGGVDGGALLDFERPSMVDRIRDWLGW